jgi:hypothetical protein
MIERVTDGMAPMESRRNVGLLASLKSFNVPRFFSSRSLKKSGRGRRSLKAGMSSAGTPTDTPEQSPDSTTVNRSPLSPTNLSSRQAHGDQSGNEVNLTGVSTFPQADVLGAGVRTELETIPGSPFTVGGLRTNGVAHKDVALEVMAGNECAGVHHQQLQ